MFRGNTGKWSRWGLGFLWGQRRGRQLEAVLGHVLETRLVQCVPGHALPCGLRTQDLVRDQVESGSPGNLPWTKN